MAERRMFAKTIIDSDAFIDMPISARLLYYDLSMRADDDGFVNAPKKIMKFVGASIDDLNILIGRKFILAFQNGIIVIKHWRIHNYIQSDRYKETTYKDLKSQLLLDENKAYKMIENNQCIQNGYNLDTQVRLGKVSIGKDSIDKSNNSKFSKPSLEELTTYIQEKDLNVDANAFMDYYDSNGWKIGGKAPMKDWKATCRRWSRTNVVKNMPQWIDKEIEKESIDDKEQKELEDMMKEFE